ncbi:MAG: type II/IV secretion system ATPase subunit [Candidatus Aenigmarchaeota archaeon]|nr:type II/IV secretion system ATPase subunit [Candidatus Aenigmarchaeota archaeon]
MMDYNFRIRGFLRRRLDKIREEDEKRNEEIDNFRIGKKKKIALLKTFENREDIDVFYSLIYPYAYARIRWNPQLRTIQYSVEQPELNEDEIKTYKLVQSALIKTIDVNLYTLKTEETKVDYIKKKVNDILIEFGVILRPGQYIKLLYLIYVDFVGLGKIEPLMNDSYIEDISCDGTGIEIYIAHKKYGNLMTNVKYDTHDELRSFIIKLSERCSRYISYAEPLLDASLPEGSRVNAMLSKDVATRGPTFTIRKFREIPFSIIDLIQNQTVSPKIVAFLWFLVEHKQNVLICGGTSSGKTSLLNSLVLFIPPENKIVSIEDTRELNLLHKNWVPSVSRTGFGDMDAFGRRYGEVTMFNLLKESFRQNPDYIIVGEVRGEEASVLFQGMASGHPSFGTIHGGSVDDVIQRLHTPPINLSNSIIEILDYLIVITRATKYGKSARRIKEINFIEKIGNKGTINYKTPYSWNPKKDIFVEKKDDVFACLNKISQEYGINEEEAGEEIRKRERYISFLLKKKILSFEYVYEKIEEYYNKYENRNVKV